VPALEIVNLRQRAVFWATSGKSRYGEPTVASPVEIRVRWEEGISESIDDSATPIAVNATVDVDRDVAAGSILRLGKLTDLPSPVTDGLMEVISFEATPDIKCRRYQRSVTVRRWRSSLPTVV
jgi:hypothetical protein